jgi:hypothetical protein
VKARKFAGELSSEVLTPFRDPEIPRVARAIRAKKLNPPVGRDFLSSVLVPGVTFLATTYMNRFNASVSLCRAITCDSIHQSARCADSRGEVGQDVHLYSAAGSAVGIERIAVALGARWGCQGADRCRLGRDI